jgi:hypothetical protein
MPVLNINGRNMSVDAASDTPLLWAGGFFSAVGAHVSFPVIASKATCPP